MTLEHFKIELEQYDWFYYFSEDHRVYQAGEQAYRRLKELVLEGGDDFKQAFNEAHAKRFNTETFATKDHPYRVPFHITKPSLTKGESV